MSKSRRVMPVLRSLVGQMTLLSLALLLLALAYFVFFPILTRTPRSLWNAPFHSWEVRFFKSWLILMGH